MATTLANSTEKTSYWFFFSAHFVRCRASRTFESDLKYASSSFFCKCILWTTFLFGQAAEFSENICHSSMCNVLFAIFVCIDSRFTTKKRPRRNITKIPFYSACASLVGPFRFRIMNVLRRASYERFLSCFWLSHNNISEQMIERKMKILSSMREHIRCNWRSMLPSTAHR